MADFGRIVAGSGSASEDGGTASARTQQEALQRVLSSYFRRADALIEKKEFNRALQEVKRVFLIEPGNLLAKQYEERITAERKGSIVPVAPAEDPTSYVPPAVVAVPAVDGPNSQEDLAPSPESQVESQPSMQPAQKGKSSALLRLVVAGVVVATLGFGAYGLFWSRSGERAVVDLDMPVAGSAPTVANQQTALQPANPIVLPVTETIGSGSEAVAPKQTTPIAVTEGKAVQKESTKQTTNKAAPRTTQPGQSPAPPLSQPSGPARLTSDQPLTTLPAQYTQVAKVESPAPQPSDPAPSAKASGSASEGFIAVEKIPEPIQIARPVYTDFAFRSGAQGMVYVKVLVDEQGKPMKAQVMKSDNAALDDMAVEAAMRSEFTPGIMSSGPVKAWVTIPFKFTIKR